MKLKYHFFSLSHTYLKLQQSHQSLMINTNCTNLYLVCVLKLYKKIISFKKTVKYNYVKKKKKDSENVGWIWKHSLKFSIVWWWELCSHQEIPHLSPNLLHFLLSLWTFISLFNYIWFPFHLFKLIVVCTQTGFLRFVTIKKKKKKRVSWGE